MSLTGQARERRLLFSVKAQPYCRYGFGLFRGPV
jgi:hypothetical protein